jgi:hypothetical protein
MRSYRWVGPQKVIGLTRAYLTIVIFDHCRLSFERTKRQAILFILQRYFSWFEVGLACSATVDGQLIITLLTGHSLTSYLINGMVNRRTLLTLLFFLKPEV